MAGIRLAQVAPAKSTKPPKAEKAEEISKAGFRKSSGPRPLVSERWLSVPNQRFTVLVLFLALQTHKFSKVLVRGSSSTDFFTCSALDFIFLWFLPVLNIPWLQFERWVTFLMFSALVALNLSLFVDDRLFAVISAIIYRWIFGKDTSVGGSLVQPSSASSKNLQGRYVVRFLPESSATLTIDTTLCISGSETVYAHLISNSTVPDELSLAGLNFLEPGQETEAEIFRVKYSRAQIAKFHAEKDTKKPDVTHIWLPLTKPGIYKLESMIDDATKLPVKVGGPPVIVPRCPSARIMDIPGPLCAGAELQSTIEVTGVAPLRVLLQDGKTLVSPSGRSSYAIDTMTIPYSARVGAGRATVSLVNVTDAFGNSEVVTNERSKSVDVYENPSARFFNAHETLALVDQSVNANIQVNGQDGPFEITYTHNDEERKLRVDHAGHNSFALSEEGSYKLKSIAGSVCGGDLSGEVNVAIPPPVDLKVQFEQVEDKCSGPSGINADIKFDGTPPFTVKYQTIKNGHIVSIQEKTTHNKQDRVTFKPHSIGSFEYSFIGVNDKYRQKSLAGIEGYSQSQTILELAGASFAHPIKTRYCAGEEVSVTARVQGKNPLDMTYLVDGKKFTETGIDGDVTLLLGKLGGGHHNVRLQSISDARGCATPLDIRTPDIFVRDAVPKARFSGEKFVEVSDIHNPPLRLPLQIDNGVPPYRIRYHVNDGPIQERVLSSPELPVTEPGTYHLDSLSDECGGEVTDETVTISLFERPKLEVISYNKSVCVGCEAKIRLLASGHGPFKVGFESRDPKKRVHYDELQSERGDIVVTIPAQELPGTYINNFWVTDSVYPNVDAQNPVVLPIVVNPEPSVGFAKPKHEYQVCQGSVDQIPIFLKGTGPYVLTLDGENLQTGKKFRSRLNIPDVRQFMLKDIFEEVTVGTYVIRLTTINDSTGCMRKIPASDANKVYITTSPSPNLAKGELVRTDYCVGDHVNVQLEGNGLFQLDYTFNGVKQRASTSSRFTRLASAPGIIQLVTLRDGTKCPRDLKDTSEIVIHDLPSSRISSQPNFSIQHGDAADLTFQFEGVPPFSFTYTRTVNGKQKLKKSVKNVQGHEYTIHATEDGEYEVIELQDAHCYVSI